jgi:hypothetical protein
MYDADLSCYLEIRLEPLNNIAFTSATNEVRYHKSVLQCYTLAIHCSSGFFSTKSPLFGSNGEALLS